MVTAVLPDSLAAVVWHEQPLRASQADNWLIPGELETHQWRYPTASAYSGRPQALPDFSVFFLHRAVHMPLGLWASGMLCSAVLLALTRPRLLHHLLTHTVADAGSAPASGLPVPEQRSLRSRSAPASVGLFSLQLWQPAATAAFAASAADQRLTATPALRASLCGQHTVSEAARSQPDGRDSCQASREIK